MPRSRDSSSIPSRRLAGPPERSGAAGLPPASDTREWFARVLDAIALDRGPWLIAVSGGLDSTALLLLIAELGPPRGIEPVVAHVDHGIHPASADVAKLVAGHAKRLGLPFVSEKLTLGADASETLARQFRYLSLHRMARDAGARGIMTAHHANDQVETVLMRVLKGSGPAGLAGMDVMTPSGIVRPLLRFPLAYLASVVAESGVKVWEDPANADPVHLRSWLRTEVLPMLRERIPEVYSNLHEVAGHARDQRDAWDALLDALPGLDLRHEGTVSVAVEPWLTGDAALARQLLAAVGRRAGTRLSQSALGRALALVQGGASGRRAELHAGWVAELSFGRLVLGRGNAEEPPVESLQGDLGRIVWNGWEIRWRRSSAGELERQGYVTWVSPGPLDVGTLQPGDRMQPLGFGGHRPLVPLFQDAKVPVLERRRWPVVRRDGEVVWVPGICRSASFAPAPQAPSIELQVSAGPSIAAPTGPA